MARSLLWACVTLYLAFSTSIVFPEVAAKNVDGEFNPELLDLAGPQHQEARAQFGKPHSESAVHRKWPTGSRATEAEIKSLLSIIEEQLDPFKDGISLEMVEKLYCNAKEYSEQATLRFQVIDGRPYLVGPPLMSTDARAQSMMAQVMNLATKFSLPDLDFLISTYDLCPELEIPGWKELRSRQEDASNCTRNAPLFVFARRDHQKQCVTVPDWSFESWPDANTPNWSTVRAWMLFAAKQRPFSNRLPRVFWRGGLTHWQRLVQLESEIARDSGMFDVESVDWGDPVKRSETWISLAKHCDYQQLLHLRGHGYSNRLKSIMLCGSPVIFPYAQGWAEKEFWYHMLIHRHNIMLPSPVTVENQAAEVVATATELNSNKRLLQEVAVSGQHLVAEVLHPDNVDKYWMALFEQYNKLQSFKPTLHLDASPLEEELLRPLSVPSKLKERTCNVC